MAPRAPASNAKAERKNGGRPAPVAGARREVAAVAAAEEGGDCCCSDGEIKIKTGAQSMLLIISRRLLFSTSSRNINGTDSTRSHLRSDARVRVSNATLPEPTAIGMRTGGIDGSAKNGTACVLDNSNHFVVKEGVTLRRCKDERRIIVMRKTRERTPHTIDIKKTLDPRGRRMMLIKDNATDRITTTSGWRL